MSTMNEEETAPMETIEKGLGLIPQVPDIRDFKFRLDNRVLKLPASVDLRPMCPPVTDQGRLGSCTGHAAAGAYRMVEVKQKIRNKAHSPLFIYYNTRTLEGSVESDVGATLRGTLKSLNQFGASAESQWKYVIEKFKKKPSKAAYASGEKNKAVRYEEVPQDINTMKACLTDGFPIIIGFAVYNSFYAATVRNTGVATFPQAGDRMMGGHAVVVVGYDDSNQWWILRNSWGTDWGAQGYFYLPYEYLVNQNLAFDFWTLKVVE